MLSTATRGMNCDLLLQSPCDALGDQNIRRFEVTRKMPARVEKAHSWRKVARRRSASPIVTVHRRGRHRRCSIAPSLRRPRTARRKRLLSDDSFITQQSVRPHQWGQCTALWRSDLPLLRDVQFQDASVGRRLCIVVQVGVARDNRWILIEHVDNRQACRQTARRPV